MSSVPAFSKWLPVVSPELRWDFRHIEFIKRQLADVTLGECNRLLINLPAQHGKSELVTIRYALWRLFREPTLRVAVTAYGQRLANKFSRSARRLAREQGMAFGDVQQVDEWETAEGGSFISRGMGAGITGNAVDLLVIDDPYKDAKQAFSPTYRENVWEWWTDALQRRLSIRGQVICIHTRWHTNDITGRFLERGGWRHIKLKALAEANDPLGRQPGEALCPELHPVSEFEEQRQHNPTSFLGMGQQEPIDREGGFFKGLERVQVVDAVPADTFIEKKVRFWDLAATEAQAGADPDYTVGVLMGKHKDGTYWVLDVVRVRVGPMAVRQLIRQTAERDGKKVPVRVEREGNASGKIVADMLVREELAGWPAKALRPEGDKAERAEPFASQVEAGNVAVVKANWNAALLDELRAFPAGTHDDQVDACSGAFAELARRGGQLHDWSVR